MTMPVPPRALSPSTRPSSACSVANWIERSSVSTRSSPATGGTETVSLPAIERPPGATSRSSRPSVPVSRSSNCSSRPPMPTPSMSVRPMTLRPVSPPGRIRLLSGSTLTPANPSAAICSPTASSTWRATYMNPVALATIAATSSWRFSSLRPRTLVRIAAVASGSSISFGLMLMLFAATDIASSSPLRSKMVPRSAGTSRERVHCRVPSIRSAWPSLVCRTPTLNSTSASTSTSEPSSTIRRWRGCPAPNRNSRACECLGATTRHAARCAARRGGAARRRGAGGRTARRALGAGPRRRGGGDAAPGAAVGTGRAADGRRRTAGRPRWWCPPAHGDSPDTALTRRNWSSGWRPSIAS